MHDARENYARLLLEIKERREWHATRTAYILLEQLDEGDKMIASSMSSSTALGMPPIDPGQLMSPMFRSVLAKVNAKILAANEWDEPTHSDASEDSTEPYEIDPSDPSSESNDNDEGESEE